MFDNTRLVTFDEKVYDKILAINSQEGEQVMLDVPVNAQGNVEVWLGELLATGRRSLHGIIRTASIAIQDPAFNILEFENTFASQVCILIMRILITRRTPYTRCMLKALLTLCMLQTYCWFCLYDN